MGRTSVHKNNDELFWHFGLDVVIHREEGVIGKVYIQSIYRVIRNRSSERIP